MSDEPNAKQRFRMDFIQEPVAIPVISEESEGEELEIERVELGFRHRPHPERYERNEDPPGWIDKFENTLIPDEVLEDMLEEMGDPLDESTGDLPRYYDPPEIEDTAEYVEARREEIELVLSGDVPPQMVEPDRGDLSKLKTQDVTDFIIINIDLVSSTALMTHMEAARATKMIQVYLREVTHILHHFHASVLDIRGDGITAYFPGPNVTGMHDNAIDCAASIEYLMEDAINDILSKYGYPELQYRIGLDTGSPEIIPQGEENYNLLGIAVNLASKIQEKASPNEILLGAVTERNLHTRWRKNTEKVTDKKDWDYEIDGELYDIYRYNTKK